MKKFKNKESGLIWRIMAAPISGDPDRAFI